MIGVFIINLFVFTWTKWLSIKAAVARYYKIRKTNREQKNDKILNVPVSTNSKHASSTV